MPMFSSTGDSKDLPNKMTLQPEHEREREARETKGETTAQRAGARRTRKKWP